MFIAGPEHFCPTGVEKTDTSISKYIFRYTNKPNGVNLAIYSGERVISNK